MRHKGYFLTFEGTEGSGKSTQIRLAAGYLRRLGYRVVLLREPGGTRVSEAIRRILLHRDFDAMTPEADLLHYLAARAQLVREKILPALKQGTVVICDRFEDSTLAYQGYGRGFSLKQIETVSREIVRGTCVPDLTVVLDIDPRAGMKRGGREDRMEKQAMSFHRRVRRGFLCLARRRPQRFLIVDATRSKQAVSTDIRRRLSRVFGS